jgi:hypothetical protein
MWCFVDVIDESTWWCGVSSRRRKDKERIKKVGCTGEWRIFHCPACVNKT